MSMTITRMAGNQLNDAMIRLSTAQRINSAADDAAGSAIMEKLESQIEGLEQGIDNTLDMQNLVATAEGGLSSIDSNLQRIRELSVQASNGIYTDQDKSIIQYEISQLTQGINDIAKGTQFNGMNLLDGSFTNKQTASAADGTGAVVSIPDSGVLALGLKDYDVTGTFDLGTVDDAIASVSNTRSYLGALSSRFDATVSANSITMLNQAAAKSRIADLDMAKESTALNRAKLINDYQLYAQKDKMENKTNLLSQLL